MVNDVVVASDGREALDAQKPVNFAEFVDAARHLGLYWLAINTPPPLSSDEGGAT